MKIMVTGVAGFIGRATAKRLLDAGHEVLGIDIQTQYEDTIGSHRLKTLLPYPNFTFQQVDISNQLEVESAFRFNPSLVVHLAAKPGVRGSLSDTSHYIQSNIIGFNNMIIAANDHNVQRFLYASSSSVYGSWGGGNGLESRYDPLNVYAMTKCANELMAKTLSHYNSSMETIGLRFFSVYGPWGRPDMAPFLFTDAISKGKPITLNANGTMVRDFTYIDDVTSCMEALLFDPDLALLEYTRHATTIIGRGQPRTIRELLSIITKQLGCDSVTIDPTSPKYVDSREMHSTEANPEVLEYNLGEELVPNTTLEEGIALFVDWYRAYQQSLSK